MAAKVKKEKPTPLEKDLADKIGAALGQKATPSQREQIGSSVFEKRVGNTAFDRISEMGTPLDGMSDAARTRMEITQKVAAKPDPTFKARQAASRAKKGGAILDSYDKVIGGALTSSPMSELESLKASDEAARMAEMQQANRRMADESNKSMNSAAAERATPAAESKPVKMVNPLDKVQESLKGPSTIYGQPNTKFASYGSLSDMAKAPVSEGMKAPDRDFEALFKKATGTSFNAKSKGDRAAMAELQDLMSKRADLADKSDTKVALAWYASKKK
jgi:hypothetical protein